MDRGEQQCLLPKGNSDGRPPPKDRCFLVYVIFYLLGIGSLLPWNFFSNAKMYFMYKLRNTTCTQEPWENDPSKYNYMQQMFEPYLTVAAMVPNVLFMFVNTAVTKIIPLRTRIVIASGTMICMFAVTVVLTQLDTSSWQVTFFALTMVTIVIMNAGSAILQGGMFGLAGIFPAHYSQSVMAGMGMGGTIAAVTFVLTIWLGSDPVNSGLGYFIFADVVIIMALAGYLCLPCLKFARHHIETKGRATSVNSDQSPHKYCDQSSYSSVDACSSSVALRDSHGLWQVFTKVWVHSYCVFIVFFVTLSCYPAVNSAIVSVHRPNHTLTANSTSAAHSWPETFFSPVTCFVFFNVGDLLGRTLAAFFQWPREKSAWLPILCTARVVFVPIFLLCNVQPRNSLPVAFANDWVPSVCTWLFAMSNGYLGTLGMMYAPRLVDPDNIQTAGSMMSFFLSLGLACGSAMSLLLVKVVL